MKNKEKMWKMIAIVFITLFVLETAYMYHSYRVGSEILENDATCSTIICRNYKAYYYDIYTKVCSCYEDEVKVFEKVM